MNIDLEHWYLIFSLMSAASSSIEGRHFVFQGLGSLIENNCVNDVNFTPCRHLVMRFMHRAFLEGVDKSSSDGDGILQETSTLNGDKALQGTEPNPWEFRAQVLYASDHSMHFSYHLMIT